MAVPRPLLLALLGVALIGVTFYASAGPRNAASEDTPAAPAQKIEAADPAPAKPAKAKPEAQGAVAQPKPGAAKPKPAPAKPKPAAPKVSKHVAVARAITSGKVVVLFFSQPG